MTTASERAANRPLSGEELRHILREDFERLLDAECLLSPHVGFGRFSYRMRLVIEVDNGYMLPSPTTLDSRPAGVNVVAEHPELAAKEAFPLVNPSAESVVVAHEARRQVRSPNRERLRTGLPVPVDVKQQDSTIVTQNVEYPPQPELQPGEVEIIEDSDAARRELGRPTVAVPPPAGVPDPAALPVEKRDFFGALPERDENAPWPTTKPS